MNERLRSLVDIERQRIDAALDPRGQVRVIGLEPGKGKYQGMMGALVVDFNGKPNKIGTGFSDLQRSNSEHFLGKMVEISYHELTKDGNMRHSRFEKERGDLE